MKLFYSFGPNPRLVHMFMLEKGIEIDSEELDLLGGENRTEPYLKKNPGGAIPALELDDGTVIAETVTICEYLEEKNPSPALIGDSPETRANTSMWIRRVELNITEHMYNGFRFGEGIDLFRDRVYCIPEAADGLKAKAKHGRKWLDSLIAERDFITGDQISLADIVLYCCMDFGRGVGQPLDDDTPNLSVWFERMDARSSANASKHPAAEQIALEISEMVPSLSAVAGSVSVT